MQLSFENRTYLVTGGGSGIGKGVAEGLAKAGANVMIVGRSADRLASAADEISAGAPARRSELPARGRHQRGPDRRGRRRRDRVDRAAARRGALRGRLADHRAHHPDRLRSVACHGRSEHQRVDVRAEAFRAPDGSRGRRLVRRHLLDRGQQHPPVVRALRCHQSGPRSSGEAGRRRTRRVLGAGQRHSARVDPDRTGPAGARLAGAERGLPRLHTAAAAG